MNNYKIVSRIFLQTTFFLLVLAGCKNPEKESTATENDAQPITENYCFLNEYPFPDSDKNIDVLELNLAVTGTEVTGHYNWLPALKDQRKGILDGTIENNVIKATYSYMQEGVATTSQITITLQENNALIKGDDPTSGLDTEVNKIACN